MQLYYVPTLKQFPALTVSLVWEFYVTQDQGCFPSNTLSHTLKPPGLGGFQAQQVISFWFKNHCFKQKILFLPKWRLSNVRVFPSTALWVCAGNQGFLCLNMQIWIQESWHFYCLAPEPWCSWSVDHTQQRLLPLCNCSPADWCFFSHCGSNQGVSFYKAGELAFSLHACPRHTSSR